VTVKQIKKFIRESIEKKIMWSRIRILGGEPILHPDISEIIHVLLDYKKKYLPTAEIQLSTNYPVEKIHNITLDIQKQIKINVSLKETIVNFMYPFNIAPIDCALYRYADYSNGCKIPAYCGMGLTPYGYYPCAIAGGIDRIFGFDIGKKRLPDSEDSMADQLKVFCRVCGHYRIPTVLTREKAISPTWQKAYENYKKNRPRLSLY